MNYSRLTELQRFSHALAAMEKERLKQRHSLKLALKVQELPSGIGEPKLLPAMNPLIQHASVDFSKKAMRIMKSYDFREEDFRAMQRRVNWNPIFCIQVQREIARVQNMDSNMLLY